MLPRGGGSGFRSRCHRRFGFWLFRTLALCALAIGLPDRARAATDSGTLTFTWTDISDNEAGFMVERSADGLNFSLIATVGADRTSFVDTGLVLGAHYWYRVCAFNGNGASNPTEAISGIAAVADNTAPAISGVADFLVEREMSATIQLLLSDAEAATAALQTWVESSDPNLLPLANVTVTGDGPERTVRLTPAAGRIGQAKITLYVSDGTFTTKTSFGLTVFTNTPPSVSPFPNRCIVQGSTTGRIRFLVEDAETPAADLSLGATSSNPGVVPVHGIVFGGSASRRTVTITPAPHATGTSTINIRVSDSGLTTSHAFAITVASPTRGRLLNLSSRVHTQNDNVPIVGLVVEGAPKRLLLRSVGPTLGRHPFNLAGVLPNPRLRLLRQDAAGYVDHASNLDWASVVDAPGLTQAAAQVFAFGLAEQSRDAALLLDLPGGQYTLVADDEDGAAGVTLVEAYDTDAPNGDGQLINLSTRGYVGMGDSVLIMGFVIASDGPQTVLLRAAGPTLAAAPFGVSGTLADPWFELYRRAPDGRDHLVATQDDWAAAFDAGYTAAIAARVSAFPLLSGSKDAACVLTLEPGTYTAIVRGKLDTCGTTLAEIYAVR